MSKRLTPTGLARLYYLYPSLAGSAETWPGHFERARDMGFEAVCLPPLFRHAPSDPMLAIDHDEAATGGAIEAAAARLAGSGQKAGRGLLIDVVLDRIAASHKLAEAFPHRYRPLSRTGAVDPRVAAPNGLVVSLNGAHDVGWFSSWWIERLTQLVRQGVSGFRLLGIDALPVAALKAIVQGVPDAAHLAWTPGLDWGRLEAMADIGLDGVFASAPWWDGRAGWYAEEHERLRRIAPVIVPLEVPFGERVPRGSDGRLTRVAGATCGTARRCDGQRMVDADGLRTSGDAAGRYSLGRRRFRHGPAQRYFR